MAVFASEPISPNALAATMRNISFLSLSDLVRTGYWLLRLGAYLDQGPGRINADLCVFVSKQLCQGRQWLFSLQEPNRPRAQAAVLRTSSLLSRSNSVRAGLAVFASGPNCPKVQPRNADVAVFRA